MKHVFSLYDEKNITKTKKDEKKICQDEVCIGRFSLNGGEGSCLHFQGVQKWNTELKWVNIKTSKKWCINPTLWSIQIPLKHLRWSV